MLQAIRSELSHLSTGRRDLRKFGFLMGVVSVIVCGVIVMRSGMPPSTAAWTFAILAAAFLVLGSIAPLLLRPLYVAWMAIAIALGFIMTRVILTLVFILVITPIGLAMRALGKDPLTKGPDASRSSYWIPKVYRTRDRERLTKYY